MRTLLVVVGVLIASSACGGREERPGGDGGRPLDAPATDAFVAGDSGGEPTRTPRCIETCSSPSDCGSTNQTGDADNFRCEAGRCRYLGCNTDAECQADFGASTWVCRAGAGLGGIAACVQTCASANDCARTAQTTNADNFVCEAGHCRYLGCNSDAECQADNGVSGGTWVCTPGASDEGLPGCTETCTSPSSCGGANETSNADNYLCTDGRCRHLGCNTDGECQADIGASTWVCER